MEVVYKLFEYGVVGSVAVLGFMLYFKERQLNLADSKTYLLQQVADTAAKKELADAVQDVGSAVDSVSNTLRAEIEKLNYKIDKLLSKAKAREIRSRERQRMTQSGEIFDEDT